MTRCRCAPGNRCGRCDDSTAADEKARFAAREFVARFQRDTGADFGEFITERILFAFEMGYLRGARDQAEKVIEMMGERD